MTSAWCIDNSQAEHDILQGCAEYCGAVCCRTVQGQYAELQLLVISHCPGLTQLQEESSRWPAVSDDDAEAAPSHTVGPHPC
jgi:hypothetical protein